jgi:subtilisin family serine protease
MNEDAHPPADEDRTHRVQSIRKAAQAHELKFVRYTSAQGRDQVVGLAQQVFQEYPDTGTMVVRMQQSDADYLLSSFSGDIARIQDDSLWSEQGQFEHTVQRRDLVETTPYGIHMIQADQMAVGPYPVQVCIVDSGLDVTHPDIDSSEVDGKNRISNVDEQETYWNVDVRRHGTHVAGIIAARADNDLGIRGVGDIPLYITRGLNDDGLALQSDILEAVEQCEKAGIKIITMSLGGEDMNDDMWELFDRLYDNGFLVFSATGNYGSSLPFYPAAHPGVIAVTAIDENKTWWNQANYGDYVELACPGSKIISTTPNATYSSFSGTSMAAPHAAGAAALLWSYFPSCTSHQIRYALAYTAEDIGDSGCDNFLGYGLVQVKDAYDFLDRHSCEDATWGQTPSTGYCSTVDVVPDSVQSRVAASSSAPVTTEKKTIKSTFSDFFSFHSFRLGN